MNKIVFCLVALACVIALAQDAIGSGGSSLSREAPLVVSDEGIRRGRASRVNCVGSGVVCTADAGTWTLTVSGGGGGGSTPSVTCGLNEALSWDGANWLCVNTVTTATRLPLTCAAGDFVTCDGGTCGCATPSGGGGGGISQADAQRLVAIGGP